MKIKLWIIVVSFVLLQGCTAALVSELTPNGGGSSGLTNLFVLLGLNRRSGGSGVSYTPIDTYNFSSGVPSGWTGTWTSTSTSCPVTGTTPCLRSAVITNSQSSVLSFTTTLKASKISFKRRVSSESNYDYCKFTIDGADVSGEGLGVSGTEDKSYEFIFSEAASRTFAWTYRKDDSYFSGLDLCSLDDVVLYGVATETGTGTTTETVIPVVVLKTGQTTSYATGDDGNLQKGAARSYTDNNDGTIKDNSTGLTWQKCSRGLSGLTCATGSATTSDWTSAGSYCSSLTLASKTWRLPTVNELLNLVDASRSVAPIINITSFPATQSGYYWSSTTYAPVTSGAWVVDFNDGSVSSGGKTNSNYVRCVSGP